MVKTTPKRRNRADENGNDAVAAMPQSRENGGETTTNTNNNNNMVQKSPPPASRLRSRKRTRRRPSDDDDDGISSVATTDNDDDDDMEEPAAKRRSTRRRRLKKTFSSDDDDDEKRLAAASTDDEQSVSSRRRINTSTATARRTRRTRDIGDDDDDESVTQDSNNNDNEEEVAQQKPRAQNGGGSSNPVAAAFLPPIAEESSCQKPVALAPISKLRMPSKHTPGKLVHTTAPAPTRAAAGGGRGGAYILEQLPPVAGISIRQEEQQQQEQQEEVVVLSPPGVGNEELNAILASGTSQDEDTPPPPPPAPPAPQQLVVDSWFQVLTTALGAIVLTIGEIATSLVIPQQVEQFAQQHDDDEEFDEEFEEEVQVTKPLLTRSYVWFLFFFALQCFCWQSILLTVEETSHKSLDFWHGMFPKEQPVVETKVGPVPSWSDEQVQKLESLSTLLESAKHNAKFPEEMEFAKRQLIEIRGRLTETGQAIDDWQGGLVDTESALRDLIHSAAHLQDVPRLFFRANEILGFFKDMVPPTLTAAQLLDTTFVFLWETVSNTECVPPNENVESNDDSILTKETCQMAHDELRRMMLSSASDIMSSEDVSTNLRMWVRKAIPEPDTAQREEMVPTNGLSHARARDVITKVLEKERADQLGVVDYASVLAGASVMKRATSPSLVDSLPLLNRLMQHARLRFYGHGPEAALTPTFPVNALGQCWAFERHPQERKGGRYATLTVQLGQPVHVTNVVVEHAPKELTNEPETAIQQFRILGYEDADATSEPWNLGSFQYDIDAPRILQQFQVANHANGELIPKLQSIALAIDSNWGSNYSCLYRFRVLGGDEPSEDIIEAAIADDFDEEYNVDSESVNSTIDAAHETTENVEVTVESEDLHAKPDSSLREGIASKDASDTNIAAERVNNGKNEVEASKSTLPNIGVGDSTNDSKDISQEETSGSEHVLDSEDDSHAQPEPEDSHGANVADDGKQMANDVDHDTNEDNVEANDNEDNVDDEEVHNWDNHADGDSGHDDNASGDHADDSREQDSEDDSRDGRYDSGDDSGDAEDDGGGDDSGDDEHASGDEEGEEYVHDEH